MPLGQDAEKVEPIMNAHELVLRESDLSRLDRLVRGLLEERLNAVVLADDEGLLDHYGRLFSGRLRQQSSVKIEVYFPNSTEAVLARFNRILADLKVSDAISSAGSPAEHRVLVVYDGQATDIKEVQLLGRLLRDFPGANTRVLMLLNRSGADAEQKVEALGKRALRWDLHRPTPDEARVLLEEARMKGSAPEAQSLLDSVGVQGLEEAMALKAGLNALAKADAALGPLGTPQQAAASFAASLQRASAQSRLDVQTPANSEGALPPAANPPLKAQEAPTPSPQRRKAAKSPLLLAGLVALSASAALTAWQHLGDRITSEFMPDKKLVSASPSVTSKATGESAPEADSTPMKTLGPLPEQVSNEELQQERKNAPLPEAPEPEPVKPEPSKPEPSKPEPPKPDAAKPTEAKGPAQAALLDLKAVAPGFYVQHASRETRAEALDYWKANPGLAKARLLKLRRIGATGDNFVLLSGPFKTLDEAKAFTQKSGIPKDTWIRPASALKKLLPEATP
ncbi:MAG: hypothetical protein RLY30_1287 [Pseudomonadota bacterium]|jgi:hypothetical protein